MLPGADLQAYATETDQVARSVHDLFMQALLTALRDSDQSEVWAVVEAATEQVRAWHAQYGGQGGAAFEADLEAWQRRWRDHLDGWATDPDNGREEADSVATGLTTSGNNLAMLHSEGGGSVTKTWLTVGDSKVRPSHRALHGTTVGVGESFDVGGASLAYPHDPSGPPSETINCRCVLALGIMEVAASTQDLARFTADNPEGEVMDTDEIEATEQEAQAVEELLQIPFHGILAPEGVMSGDRRKFMPGSVTNRDLPLPLYAQKATAEGHDGAVIVGRIDTIDRRESPDGQALIGYEGVFLSTEDADETIMLVGEGALRGVSIDADDVEMHLESEDGTVFDLSEGVPMEARPVEAYDRIRVSAATAVGIPAFPEAFIALGTWADEEASESVPDAGNDDPQEDVEEVEEDDEIDSMAASGLSEDLLEQFAKTEDGPGWLTHPVDTDRLRDYWVRGPGAAKIGWGAPGDFNRCRVLLAKYVKPQHLSGYCANRHYDALKTWPGRHGRGKHGATTLVASGEMAPSLRLVRREPLVADGGQPWRAVKEWFEDPKFTGPSNLCVTDEGRIYGHLATWGTCHIGFDGVCIEPPTSPTNYQRYRLGTVLTADGEQIPVGRITMGTGHADTRLSASAAAAHYDNTGTCVGFVASGEDEHGIWIAGQVAPGVTEDQITMMRASCLSGDWRDSGQGIDLVAALVVNVPGFPIPHPALAASAAGQVSLVAAGIVTPAADPRDRDREIATAAARAVLDEQQARTEAKAKMQALRASRTEREMSALRRSRLAAITGGQ